MPNPSDHLEPIVFFEGGSRIELELRDRNLRPASIQTLADGARIALSSESGGLLFDPLIGPAEMPIRLDLSRTSRVRPESPAKSSLRPATASYHTANTRNILIYTKNVSGIRIILSIELPLAVGIRRSQTHAATHLSFTGRIVMNCRLGHTPIAPAAKRYVLQPQSRSALDHAAHEASEASRLITELVKTATEGYIKSNG